MLELYMLASGSSGNAVYVATENTKILIDAGLSGKRLAKALAEIGTDAAALDALLLSHDHLDHIYGAGVLAKRYHLPVYATQPTWNAAGKRLGGLPADLRRFFAAGEKLVFAGLEVETFPVPHDAAGPVGFIFRQGGRAAALVTDLGYVTPYIMDCLQNLDGIVIEANHDEEMLFNGRYPWPLKRRIGGKTGHLSNVMAAECLTQVISPKTKQVVLAHLSAENNLPSLALDTTCSRLEAAGIATGKQLTVRVAARHEPSCRILFT
ncbi:MAG: MBL fold metallo-hydrolase [Firmicutes bacterium]|nr:MBL fold metallo-hydrolase [Bacillota bacterium]